MPLSLMQIVGQYQNGKKIENKNISGLDKSKKLLSHLDEISVIDFDHSDVVRHPLVSKIVKAYSNHND